MRQITIREKAFLSMGALAAVAIFVWFVMLPWLRGGESGPASSMEEMEAKLEAFENLEEMGQPLIALEGEMKSQSGYERISFRAGTANSVIISIINNFLSDAANQAGIRNLEQLDTKVETRKTQTETVSSKAVLGSIVDRLYLQQVMSDLESIEAIEAEEVDSEASDLFGENSEEDVESDPGAQGENEGKDENSDESSIDDSDSESRTEGPEDELVNAPEDAPENVEKSEAQKLMFPVVPVDIPGAVRDSLGRAMERRQGKTLLDNNINEIIDDAGFSDEKERIRIKNRLKAYSNRVRERKNEITRWFETIGVLDKGKTSDNTSKFSVKMIFKSQIQQLVNLLYNLQDSARWLKIESLRVSIADKRETLLGIELNMTATALRGI